MKYAPIFLLLIATPGIARDRSIDYLGPNVRAQLREIKALSTLDICQLEGVTDQQRQSYNQQVLMNYNRMIPAPTTVVDIPPNRFFTRHR